MSPELRSDLIKIDQGKQDQLNCVDWVKNDIFSLGLKFLKVLTLESVDNLNSSTGALDKICYYLE